MVCTAYNGIADALRAFKRDVCPAAEASSAGLRGAPPPSPAEEGYFRVLPPNPI